MIEKTEIYGMIDVLDIAIYLAELCDNEGTLDLKYLFEKGDVEAEKFISNHFLLVQNLISKK